MAEYGVDISVRVKKDQVNQLGDTLKQVEKQVGTLNKVKINLDTTQAIKSVEALNAKLAEAEKITNRFFGSNTIRTGIGAFSKDIAGIKTEVSALSTALSNSKNDTTRTTLALEVLTGQLKAARLEGQAFAKASGQIFGASGFGNLSIRIKEIEALPRNFYASSEALKELTAMQSMAVQGTDEWLQINEALGRQLAINANLALTAQRAQAPMPADPFGLTKRPLMLPAAGESSGTFQIIERSVENITQDSARRAKYEKDIAAAAKATAAQYERQNRAQQKAVAEASRQMKAQKKAAGDLLQNVLLGAGFPLLFGGGPGAVLGGALGAGGGFAGQIALSALGQQLDTFVAGVAELGQALNPLTADIDKIIEKTGLVGTKMGSLIRELNDAEDAETALELATRQLALVVGDDGVEALKNFGSATQELTNEFSRMMTLMGTSLADLLTGPVKALTDYLNEQNLVTSAAQSSDMRLRNLAEEYSSIIVPTGFEDFPIFTKEVKRQEEILQKIADITDELKRKEEARAETAKILADTNKDYLKSSESINKELDRTAKALNDLIQQTKSQIRNAEDAYLIAVQEEKISLATSDRQKKDLQYQLTTN